MRFDRVWFQFQSTFAIGQRRLILSEGGERHRAVVKTSPRFGGSADTDAKGRGRLRKATLAVTTLPKEEIRPKAMWLESYSLFQVTCCLGKFALFETASANR